MDESIVQLGLLLFGMLTFGCFAAAFGVDSRPGFEDPGAPAGGIDF